jgi:hypothetical protein
VIRECFAPRLEVFNQSGRSVSSARELLVTHTLKDTIDESALTRLIEAADALSANDRRRRQ